ncbi:MAG: post-transcriptional regulator [Bacilli bacterium]|nr:post-transcriptional regulator [Bacilli bacterium]
MEIEFKSQEELYKRLKPALNTKKDELNVNGYGYLKIEDIWNYLKENKWKTSHDLSLNEMVSDILNADNELIDAYFKTKINEKNRKIYFDI